MLPRSRIFGFDVLRSIAILVVVVGHGKPILQMVGSGFPYIPLPDGVELFFVLSGFLIGQILMRDAMATGKDLYTFWARRWLRTLPLYYVFLLLNIGFSYLGWLPTTNNHYSWHFWLFLQNFNTSYQGFFWESWSLAIEEWFYLLYPLLLLLMLRIFAPRNAHGVVLLFMLLLPLLLRLYKYAYCEQAIDGFFWDTEFRKIVVLRLDAIGFGVLAAWGSWFFPKFWAKLPFIGLGIAAFLQLVLWNYAAAIDGIYKVVFSFSILGFCYALLLPVMEIWRVEGGKWWQRAIAFISKISYSMYLVNLMVFQIIVYFFLPNENIAVIEAWALFGLYLGATFLFSFILYRAIEKPFLRLRERYFSAERQGL